MTPADFVLALHLAFILFAAFGGILALRWSWIRWVHIPAAMWGAFVEASGRICPLTPLESRLRERAGAQAYAGDFIEHYLGPIVYPPNLTREIQLSLTVLLIVVNAAIYTVVWRRRARRHHAA